MIIFSTENGLYHIMKPLKCKICRNNNFSPYRRLGYVFKLNLELIYHDTFVELIYTFKNIILI